MCSTPWFYFKIVFKGTYESFPSSSHSMKTDIAGEGKRCKGKLCVFKATQATEVVEVLMRSQILKWLSRTSLLIHTLHSKEISACRSIYNIIICNIIIILLRFQINKITATDLKYTANSVFRADHPFFLPEVCTYTLQRTKLWSQLWFKFLILMSTLKKKNFLIFSIQEIQIQQ